MSPQSSASSRVIHLSRHTPTRLSAYARHFHISRTQQSSSPLFHLAALSNARESRYFKKASKLSQVEHSPALQLIRSSEVEPFGGVKVISTDESKDVGVKKVSKTENVTPPTGQLNSKPSWTESSRTISQKELSEKLRRAGENAFIAKPSIEATSRASTGTAGKFERAAHEEIGRVAEAIFPSGERVVPMSRARSEAFEDINASEGQRNGSQKPWEQFGISKSEYAALRNLEEGGGNNRRRNMRKEAAELRSEADAIHDEKMWGPDVPQRAPGVSDGEWMANVMQFRNEAELGRRQVMQDQAAQQTPVSQQGFASWTAEDEALLHKMHKEGKLLSEAFRSRSGNAEQGSARSWTEEEKRILEKLSEEGRRVGDMPFKGFRETRGLEQDSGGRGGQGGYRRSEYEEPSRGKGKSGTAKWVIVASLVTGLAVWNLKPAVTFTVNPEAKPASRLDISAAEQALQRHAEMVEANERKVLASREYAKAGLKAHKETEERMLAEVAEQAKKDTPKSTWGWFWSS